MNVERWIEKKNKCWKWTLNSKNKNENSKRFVTLLDIKSENGNRGIWGSTKEKNEIWEKMYESEPRGGFIQFWWKLVEVICKSYLIIFL